MFHNLYGDKFDDDEEKENLKPRQRYGNQGMFPYQYTEFEPFIANVYEMKDHYLIKAELPGVKKEDIEIEVWDGKVVIVAKRRKLCEGEQDILCQERIIGEYKRKFEFTNIDEDKIKASLEYGILSVKVDKAEPDDDREAKKIEIE